ncbi:MAG: transporter associated domain-containing protein [Pseudomonadota bacterium]
MNDKSGSRKSAKLPKIKTSYFKKLFGVFRRKKKSAPQSLSRLSSIPIIQQFAAFASITAGSVMFPRNEIVGVDKTASSSEMLAVFNKHPLSAIVVYENSLDQVIGQVKIHDVIGIKLAKNSKASNWLEYVKPVILVTENTSLIELALKLYYAGDPIALVVDEYGGIDGIVSQDHINNILCKRISKQNRTNLLITKMSDNVYQMPAKIKIVEFEEAMQLKIADKINQNCETLGGLIMVLAGKVPKVGEKVTFTEGSIEFTVLEADLSRIKRLAVKVITE